VVVPGLLNSTYGTSNITKTVSLIIAREEQYKSVSLLNVNDSTDVDTGENVETGEIVTDLTMYPGAEQTGTYASLQLAPFQVDDGRWVSADIYEYLIGLKSQLAAAIDDSEVVQLLSWFGEDSENINLVKLGAVALARNFYMMFYLGDTSLVEQSQDGPLSSEVIVDAEQNSDFNEDGVQDEPVLYLAGHSVALLQIFLMKLRRF
jgi:hypothetical protein